MIDDNESTLARTGSLIQVFLENTFDYLRLFIPLLLVYKLYQRYSVNKKTDENSILIKFLNLFTYGTGKSASAQTGLPTTVHDTNVIIEKNIPSKHTENEREETTNSKKIFQFLICFVGLQVSFLIWGVMQERIIKYGYKNSDNPNFKTKEDIENFKNSQFLVLSNRFAGLILSLLIMFISNRQMIRIKGYGVIKLPFSSMEKIASSKNWAPLFVCSYSSLSNVLSSWFQYESLKYVSFTSQLLAKSSKSVFVMLTGKIVSNKNYKAYEYLSVFLIGVGIFLFSDLNKNDMNQTNKILSTTFPGFVCLLGYLVTDSFTSTWQDNLIKTYSMSSISLMFMTNFYSCLYTLVSLIYQNQLEETFGFMSKHSEITHHIVLLSITSAIGQIFIFVTIQKFGALVFSLMMTTRQILSIFLSSIIFNHSMSFQSVIGVSVIFFALFLQQYFKFREKNKKTFQRL
ncbi:unnamed protein product [Brachionus calyciflorus]|uniref:Adenosine 3'-phospho 5'-phosphosulfate transporter 1 n=1 Tax=Brachionus calyciflorus TaxID=104777 RepID=A0A814CG50_9BILA|nr:unnamed protein product [Brachionus calyciflorus]